MMPMPTLDFYDEWLKSYPVPYEARMVATNFGATHVLISGAETLPPLVLIHGASVNAIIWAQFLPALTQRFRTYSIDVPGYPNKSIAKRLPNRGSGLADWLKQTLDGLGVQKTAIMGISLGGWITLNFTSHYPDTVERLVVLVPAGVTPVPVLKGLWHVFLARLKGRAGRREFINRMRVQPLPSESEARLITMLEATKLTTGVLPLPLSDEQLQRIQQPALLIVGSEDYFFPPDQVTARLKQWLPRLEVVHIPECGHLCTAEKPSEVQAAMLHFLR